MRLSSKTRPRHDPRKIYDIHADRAAGLTPSEIAAKHDLPATTIQGFLRSTAQACALLSPYDLQRNALPANAAVQVYWLGFIAASGRVFGQNNLSTLVLAIHPDDAAHIQTLLQDLIIGHATCEFADSSLDGRQVYVRDRQLAERLLQWGISAMPAEGSIPLEFIPRSLVSDFVRGYLEGSRHSPPFGGVRRRVPSPRSMRALALVGHMPLIEGLSRLLQSVCGIGRGAVAPFGRTGLTQVTFSSGDSARILEYVYRNPVRTMPRAASLAERFVQQDGPRPRRASRNQAP